MTKRQVRELLILVIVIAVGVVLGMAVRVWMTRTRLEGESTGTAAHPGASGSAGDQFVSIPDDRIVARLEGKDVTGATLNKYVDFNLGAAGVEVSNLPPVQVSFVRRQALNQMAEDRILARYAEERGVSVTPEDIEEKIAEARADYESDEAFEKDIREGLRVTREELREFMRSLLLKQKVVDTLEPSQPVTEEQVDRELSDMREQMKQHPGGDVEITREFVRSNLETRERRRAYEEWLARQMETVDLEIIEPSLLAPPISPEGGANPHSGMTPPAPELLNPHQTPPETREEKSSG